MRFFFAILFAVLVVPAQVRAEVASRNVAPVALFQEGILAVEQFGTSGPPLIFVPALGCGSWQWNAQIDALSNRYEIFAVTLPGFDGQPMVSSSALMQRAVRDIDGLPAHTYKEDGEMQLKPCAEVLLTDEAAEMLLDRGFMPLASMKN